MQSAKCSVFSGKVAFQDKLGAGGSRDATASGKQQPGSAGQRRMCALRLLVTIIISISISIVLTTEYAQSTSLTCSHEADEAKKTKKTKKNQQAKDVKWR